MSSWILVRFISAEPRWELPGFFLSFFFFSEPYPRHMEIAGWGGIGAVGASLYHSHSNARSEPHMRLTPQLLTMPILNPLRKARD